MGLDPLRHRSTDCRLLLGNGDVMSGNYEDVYRGLRGWFAAIVAVAVVILIGVGVLIGKGCS
jgi:type IV secretory pathway VirB2 component (pilin)